MGLAPDVLRGVSDMGYTEPTPIQAKAIPLAITGRDLIALGWKPGPHFGPILEAIQTAQLEGTLTTKEEALAWIKANPPSQISNLKS